MNSKQIIIGLILVALLGIVASNTFSIYESGFTVTSVSTSPNFITPSTDLNSANFLVTTVLDGGGQSIVGYLSPSEMEKESGYETEYPLSISISAVDEIVDYPIINDPTTKLFKYEIAALETSIFNKNPTCPIRDGLVIKQLFFPKLTGGMKYCIYEKDVGNVGYLNSPTTSFNSKITLVAHGKTLSQEINSFDSTSVIFRDESNKLLATARWTGNLVTGNQPPSAHLYSTTYRTDLGSTSARWRVTDASKLTSYLDTRSQLEPTLNTMVSYGACVSGDFVGCQTKLESIINNMNLKLNALSTGSEVGIGDNPKTYLNKNSLSGSTLRTSFDRKFGNPEIVFSINAAWLGVKFGVGEPKIISANCPTFSSGDNIGVCDVTIKNTGTAAGTFRASFISASGSDIRQQYVVTPVTLDPDMTTSVQVYLSHGTSVEESTTGTIKVTDIADPSRFDTKLVGISMTQPKSCVPYSEEARGQSIYKCNPQGTGWDFVKTCPTGTVPALNEAKTNLDCKDLEIPIPIEETETSILDDLLKLFSGDGTASMVNTILIVVLIVIFAVIGLLMFYGIVKAVILKKVT